MAQIDSSIAMRGMQPVQPVNLADAYQKAASLNNTLLQNQIQYRTLDQMKKDMQDELTARSVLADATPQNLRQKMSQLYQQIGPSATKYIAAIAKEHEDLDRMDQVSMDNRTKRLTNVANGLYGITNVEEPKRPQAYKTFLKMMTQGGYLKPEDVGSVLPAEYDEDAVNLMTRLNTSVKDQQTAANALARAKAYSSRVDSLNQAALNKNEVDMDKLDIMRQQLQRQLDNDMMIDDRERLKIQNDLDKTNLLIRQRQSEEAGRNRRADTAESGRNKRADQAEEGRTARFNASEANKTERLKYVQGMMSDRAEKFRNRATDAQIANTWRIALQSVAPDKNLEDLDEDEINTVNDLAESLIERRIPQVTKEPTGLFGWGSGKSIVNKGAEAPKSGQVTTPSASTVAPPETSQVGATMRVTQEEQLIPKGVTPLKPIKRSAPPATTRPPKPVNAPPPGKVWVFNGTEWGAIDANRAEAYLKANPKASR